jgi:hypothetical protein
MAAVKPTFDYVRGHEMLPLRCRVFHFFQFNAILYHAAWRRNRHMLHFQQLNFVLVPLFYVGYVQWLVFIFLRANIHFAVYQVRPFGLWKGRDGLSLRQLFPLFCYIIDKACLKFWYDASEPQEVSRLQLFRMKLRKRWKSKFFYPSLGQSADGVICHMVTLVHIMSPS